MVVDAMMSPLATPTYTGKYVRDTERLERVAERMRSAKQQMGDANQRLEEARHAAEKVAGAEKAYLKATCVPPDTLSHAYEMLKAVCSVWELLDASKRNESKEGLLRESMR